jgi:hypothetical protein
MHYQVRWGRGCSWICDTGMSFKQSTMTISTQHGCRGTWQDFAVNWSEVPPTRRSTLKACHFGRIDSTMLWTPKCGVTQRYNNMTRPQEGKIKSNQIHSRTQFQGLYFEQPVFWYQLWHLRNGVFSFGIHHLIPPAPSTFLILSRGDNHAVCCWLCRLSKPEMII